MTDFAGKALRAMVWPLIDLKNGSVRLREWRALEGSQWDSVDRRLERQEKRLRGALEYAYQNVSYYRTRWPGRPEGPATSWLSTLPILTKTEVRERQSELVSGRFQAGQLVEARTGGSTGTALRVLFDRECQDRRNAAALRSNRWAGWLPAEPAGALWGNPPQSGTLRERLRRALSERFVYLDTIDVNADTVRAFMAQLRRKDIRVLFGHAHSLFIVARLCQTEGIECPALKTIVSTSMMLLQSEREAIEAQFACPVTDRYGCEEVGLVAAECECRNGLHINDDHLYVELLREDGSPAAPGEPGQIVVTDLINRGMPLIRYAVGDVSAWLAGDCPCHRTMRRLERVLGRTADFLQTTDGRMVAGVSLVERTLTAIEGLAQLQLVQKSPEHITARCVSDAAANRSAIAAQLRSILADAFGTATEVVVEFAPRLSQDPSGKYRFSICEIPGTRS